MKRLIFVAAKLLNFLETILNIYVKMRLFPKLPEKIRFRTAYSIDCLRQVWHKNNRILSL